VAFSVQDFHGLIRLLEQHPDWWMELRRLILTEELLNLPSAVQRLVEAQERTEQQLRALAERVDALAEGQRVLTESVGALTEAQRRTEERLGRLEGRVDRVEQHLADLGGSDRERRYRERASAYFGRLLRRVRVVAATELDDLLDEGVASGALDEESVQDVRWADLIVGGRRPGDDQDTYLVVEVSVAVDSDDVERAARRAAVLGRLRPTLAVVAGDQLTMEAAALAEARGVWQMVDGRVVKPSSAT
jgi:hypothetical protein